SVAVSASVTETVAVVQKPSDADLGRIVGESANTGTVTIDVSGLGKDIKTASIPTETVKEVEKAVNDVNNDATGRTVKLPQGSVTFDGKALSAVTEQAEGVDIQFNLDGLKLTDLAPAQQTAVKEIKVQVILDAYMTSNGHRISDFKGGKATVSVPYTLKDGQSGEGVTVWYVADDGTSTQLDAHYDGQNVVFDVYHFSNYLLAYDEEKAAAVANALNAAKNCPKDETCPISAFTDASPAEWYHDGVHWALQSGMMNGIGKGIFQPNGTTTRAQVATMLWRLAGSKAFEGTNAFTDVDTTLWYGTAVGWANSAGVVTGYTKRDGKLVFNPNGAVTRQELAAMIYRFAKLNGDGFTGTWAFNLDYPDAGNVSDWAYEPMCWMTMKGVINGIGGTLQAEGYASRAQVATMLMRFMSLAD
nr:S-layer homology domain-containing protein [Clostridia bacterium]